MAWHQNSFDREATPDVGKIRKGGPPFFVLAVHMVFINKPINNITLTNVTLIVLSVVLVGDLLLQLKKIREERIVLGSHRQGNWRLRGIFWHVLNGDTHCGEIVELNEVGLLFGRLGRVEGNVHDSA